MKRLRLATKLALAIVPIGIVAMITGGLVSWTFLGDARAEDRASQAAEVALDAMSALRAVSAEQAAVLDVALGSTDTEAMTLSQESVDAGLSELAASAGVLEGMASGDQGQMATVITRAADSVTAWVAETRAGSPLAQTTADTFDQISNGLITIVSQSTFYFQDGIQTREGAAATALARASLASFQQERLISRYTGGAAGISAGELDRQILAIEATVIDWLRTAEESSPTVAAMATSQTEPVSGSMSNDLTAFPTSRDDEMIEVAQEITAGVATAARADANSARTEALALAAGVLIILTAAGIASLTIGRSMVRRVGTVTAAARQVAQVDLPNMVDALRNPHGHLEPTQAIALEDGGDDEVGELSRSFTALHSTLVEVADKQMDILRKGVSEIFVTLARRNRSLVDRQLALIDQLESDEEDPEVLGGYYKLDHLATRMRRNAESLLVLAGTESPRVWSKPLDMGDVIRAAMGEVDDYQRVDVLALEPARLSGGAVTDLAHLTSELLDNATQYSAPSERVRVTGLFDNEGYVLSIADSGMGMSASRLAELNRLMEKPPVLGLALEPTLGMYVVSRLAARHGISVRLVAGVPGTTVKITVPRGLLETGAPARAGQEEAVPPASTESKPEGPWMSGSTTGEAKGEEKPQAVSVPPYAFRGGRGRHTDEAAPPERPPARTEPDHSGSPAAKPASSNGRHPGSGDNRPVGRPPSQALPVRPVAPSETGSSAAPDLPRPTPPPVAPPARRDDEAAKPSPLAGTGSGLPVRNPGANFSDEAESPAASSQPSQRGAEGIRQALVGYRMGRETASPSSPTRQDQRLPTDEVTREEEGSDE